MIKGALVVKIKNDGKDSQNADSAKYSPKIQRVEDRTSSENHGKPSFFNNPFSSNPNPKTSPWIIPKINKLSIVLKFAIQSLAPCLGMDICVNLIDINFYPNLDRWNPFKSAI